MTYRGPGGGLQPARRGQPRAAGPQPCRWPATARRRMRQVAVVRGPAAPRARRRAVARAAGRGDASALGSPTRLPLSGRAAADRASSRRDAPRSPRVPSTPASSACARAVAEAARCRDDALHGRALAALGGALVHAVRGRDEEGVGRRCSRPSQLALADGRPRDRGARPTASSASSRSRPAGGPTADAWLAKAAGRWPRPTSELAADPRRPRHERVRPRRLPRRLRAPRRVGRAGRALRRPPTGGVVAVDRSPERTCCAASTRQAAEAVERLARARPAAALDGVPAVAAGASGRARPARRRRRRRRRRARAAPGRWPASSATRAGRAWPRAASGWCTARAATTRRRRHLAHRGGSAVQPGARPLPVGARVRARRRRDERARAATTSRRPAATWQRLPTLAARCDMREFVVRAYVHQQQHRRSVRPRRRGSPQ